MAVTVTYAKNFGGVRDTLWTFSDNQAITTDAISENVVDLGSHNVDGALELGNGNPKKVVIVITETFAGGTSMDFQLQTAEDAAGSSAVTLATTGVILDAKLVKGTVFELTIPANVGLDRYLLMNYVDVGAHSAGKIDCHLVG